MTGQNPPVLFSTKRSNCRTQVSLDLPQALQHPFHHVRYNAGDNPHPAWIEGCGLDECGLGQGCPSDDGDSVTVLENVNYPRVEVQVLTPVPKHTQSSANWWIQPWGSKDIKVEINEPEEREGVNASSACCLCSERGWRTVG